MRERGYHALLWLPLVPFLLFPGDVSWVNDEPNFIRAALENNAAHHWATAGLVGSVGLRYGPGAIWFYQALLALTHDLTLVVLLKSAFTIVAVLSSFLYIASVLEWSPWPLLLLWVSPYLYLYSRLLWDNVLLIPLSALLLALAVRLLAAPSAWALACAVLATAALLLTHPMSALLALPLWAVVLASRWRWVLRGKNAAAGIAALIAGGLSAFPYARILWTGHRIPTVGNGISFSDALWNGLGGARLFSSAGFSGAALLPPWLAAALAAVSGACACLFFRGLRLALRDLRDAGSIQARLAWIALGTMALSVVVYLPLELNAYPHYLNGVWVVFFYLLWRGYEGFPWRNSLLAVHAGSLALVLVLVAARVHENGGDRGAAYGALLSDQIAAAARIPKAAWPDRVHLEVENYRLYPQALGVLVELYGKPFSPPRGARYSVEYADADPAKGWIRTVEKR